MLSTAAVSPFDIPECVFTASTHRPMHSDQLISCVPERVATWWSCRADASKAFIQGYPEIRNAHVRAGKEHNIR